MNALGGDAIDMLLTAVREASAGFDAIVVANDAVNFTAGANLMLLLLEAQEGNWEDVDQMVRAFQRATMALKYADVPVVVAPAGLTLGGGCEIVLHATRVQAAAESYIGLVEAGVGLIPAGGGTKEMLARALEGLPAGADPQPHVQRVFETIGFAKVSTSGLDARHLRFLRDGDAVTMNRDRLLADAKATARLLANGYQPSLPRTAIPVGGAGLRATLDLGIHLALRAGRITDHDALVGRRLAWVLTGGDRPHPSTLSEQQLARSRTGGVSQPLRRAQDARADRAHVEDRQAAAQLSHAKEGGSVRQRQRTGGRRDPRAPGTLGMDAAGARRPLAALPRRQLLARPRTRPSRTWCVSSTTCWTIGELGRAAICGVSFGGLVAATFAAARAERTSALVLVSTPSPSWRPNPVQARYLARPWLSTPAFLASSPGRLWPEIAAAIEGTPARLRFCLALLRTDRRRPNRARRHGGQAAPQPRRRPPGRLRRPSSPPRSSSRASRGSIALFPSSPHAAICS